MSERRVTGVVLVLLGLLAVVEAWRLSALREEMVAGAVVGDDTFPLVVGVSLLALGAYAFFFARWPAPRVHFAGGEERRRLMSSGGALVAYYIITPYLGYTLSTLVVATALYRAMGGQGPRAPSRDPHVSDRRLEVNGKGSAMHRFQLLLVILVCVLASALPAWGKTFTVNSTADMVDASPGDGECDTGRTVPPPPAPATPSTPECTLRAAIQEANALAGADTIILPAGTYTLTIPGRAEDSAAAGDLDITAGLTITGAGAATTVIEQACETVPPATTCAGIDRVFHVDPSGARIAVVISGVTIQNGATVLISFVDSAGGGILLGVANTLGGTIPSGTLTLTGVVVRNNSSPRFGAGIANKGGTLTLLNSAVSGNAGGEGGGIFNDFISTLSLNGSTVSDNTAGQGGGIFSLGGGVTLVNSTLSNNQGGGAGGGIFNHRATVRVTNSTISSNNVTGSGGGLLNSQGVVVLNSSTITGNRAGTPGTGGTGGGILGDTAVTLSNTIVAGNTVLGAPLDCAGILTSRGYNLIQSDRFPGPFHPSCFLVGDLTGNIIGQDARLGPLGNNGGPTRTHALLGGSPAIGSGNPAPPGGGGNACTATDQRGTTRPQPSGGRCDIGAVELGELGVSLFGIQPDRAGNGGRILTLIFGDGFMSGATARLTRAGEPDIIGNPVAVGAGNTVVAASFDLSRKATGPWDVVVTNQDGTSLVRLGAFTIEEARAPQLWVDLIGRETIRIGRPARFTLLYGNRGNNDAVGVPLEFGVGSNVAFSLRFPITPPPPQAGQVPRDWSQVPITTVSGDQPDMNLVHLLLPVIPAGFVGVLQFTVTAPIEAHGQTLTMLKGIGSPYFQPNLNPQVIDDFIEGAQENAQANLSVTIPPELVPHLEQYLTTQLQSVVARGLNAWVASVGTETIEVYSVPQLQIDLTQFAAARVNK